MCLRAPWGNTDWKNLAGVVEYGQRWRPSRRGRLYRCRVPSQRAVPGSDGLLQSVAEPAGGRSEVPAADESAKGGADR